VDPILIAAYVRMVRQHGASVDDILVDPQLREEFLAHCRLSLAPDTSEESILRRLHNLRKQSKLPRSNDILVA
jgi:hypothetical protein